MTTMVIVTKHLQLTLLDACQMRLLLPPTQLPQDLPYRVTNPWEFFQPSV